ncbi:virulence factor Mce family protein [Haloechinothrix alba]|uniref:Virulence factor Mce family protein n=1 Tax=Haloechinothrix alba TaxID=664784 RepID=A0A238YH30_9PSEU|nr:MCE family protein [Haloechinothrix alba]SNR70556.1 virulence factor Mce family protein [Haloechinothrix alba]
MSAPGAFTTLRRRLLGVAFIGLVVGAVWLSVADFQGAFTPVATVKLETDKVGNQLKERSDVKARGVIVGQVDRVVPREDGATLELALDPDKIDIVPADATALLTQKTLFGERFVSLQFEGEGTGPSLSDGDVITQDRTRTALELYAAFENLLPTLQAVQPQKLNSTLTVMANALEGRGGELGETLTQMSEHFAELEPHLPELQENFANLAEYSHNLSDAVPDVAQMLDNFAANARTVVDKQQDLFELYGSVTTSARDFDAFLEANRDNIIALNETSRPAMETIGLYSPEFPCVIGQMAGTVDRLDEAFGKGTEDPGLRAEVVITPNRGKYEPGQDEPEYNQWSDELGYRGPYCVDPDKLPDPLPYPYPPFALDDGSEHPPPARSELDGQPFPCDAIETFGHPIPEGLDCAPGTRPEEQGGGGSTAGANPANSPANTPAEHMVLSELVGLQLDKDADDMPGWTGLLVGPLYRGAEVSFE